MCVISRSSVDVCLLYGPLLLAFIFFFLPSPLENALHIPRHTELAFGRVGRHTRKERRCVVRASLLLFRVKRKNKIESKAEGEEESLSEAKRLVLSHSFSPLSSSFSCLFFFSPCPPPPPPTCIYATLCAYAANISHTLLLGSFQLQRRGKEGTKGSERFSQ